MLGFSVEEDDLTFSVVGSNTDVVASFASLNDSAYLNMFGNNNSNIGHYIGVSNVSAADTIFNIGPNPMSNTFVIRNSNLGVGTWEPNASIHVKGNALIEGCALIGGGAIGGGAFMQQQAWDTPSASHVIAFPSYCVGEHSAGTITIQVTNKQDKIGNVMVSWLKMENSNVNVSTMFTHATNVATLTVSASTSNILVATDADCKIAWTSTGAY